MGRAKEFDEDEVLDRVMIDFWETGYNALSIRGIEESTGVLKGSLYAAFGDKHSLFLAALERYIRLGRADVDKLLAKGPTPRAAIERYLRARATRCTGPLRSRGCLLANTAIELAPHDAEVSSVAATAYRAMVDQLVPTLREGQRMGQISRDKDAKTLAEYLVVLVQGMNVVGKTDADGSMVRAALKLALRSLDDAEKSADDQ
jgi:TetR/AcrR family transcriptional repressor of nem operon